MTLSVLFLVVTVVVAVLVTRMDEPEVVVEAPEVSMRAAVMNALEDYHGDCDNPLPVQARLSALFVEWGSRDAEAAMAFLESEAAREVLVHPEFHARAKLRYATFVGYSKRDPKGAWARLLDEISNGDVISINTGPPRIHEVAAEEIFRNWLRMSPDEAMGALRKMEGQMMPHALRVVMEETSGASGRKALYDEFKSAHGNGIVLAGVCKHDPKQAWEMMNFVDDGMLMTTDSPRIHAGNMIDHWALKEPLAARQFLASLDDWELVESLSIEYMTQQGRLNPELFIETLEMKPFDALQLRFQVEMVVEWIMGGRFDWPLRPEGELPLRREVRMDRLEKAVKNSGLNSTLKHKFHTAIAKQRERMEKRESCGH